MRGAALAVLLTLAACVGQDAAPAPAEAAVPPVALTPLSEGVWLHTSYKIVAPWGPIRTNGLVVADPDGVWLVDTAWTDDQTAAVVALAEAALGRPVTHAVFTHAHEDKMGGVAALRAAGVETHALAETNVLAGTRGLVPAEHDLSEADGEVALPEGAPGGFTVFFPGAGHTTDNVVVHAPGAGVLFGGCLIRPAGTLDLGYSADGDVVAWGMSVRRAAARFPDAEVIVPSHGAPGGRGLLDHTMALADAR